jgi:uncharacterized protein YbaP (TraB family)
MKNTIRLITTFLLTLIGLGINAQEKAGILYKISGNGLEEPSFLFGTMHMICEDYFNQSGALEAVMSQVDHVVMELDMDDPAVATEMKKYSANPKDVKEINELPSSKRDMIDTWFQLNYGMGVESLDTLRPFAIYSLMVPKFMSCNRLISLEMEIVSSARASQKEISGLETVQEQIAIFEEIPAEEQLSWILQMINNEQYYKDEMTKMMQAYADQDLKLLNEITINSPEFGEHLDIMLYQRNQNWIEKIKSSSAEQSTLFAVGAGHLGGEQGVITLLKEQGYTIEPL